MSEQEVATRLAQIGEDGFVRNVIEAPPGVGPEYAVEFLRQGGTWVLDSECAAGVGMLYDAESGTFAFPETPVEYPVE